MHTHMHTYINKTHTHTHTYTHTHIHIYTQTESFAISHIAGIYLTYIHTYIHTYTRQEKHIDELTNCRYLCSSDNDDIDGMSDGMCEADLCVPRWNLTSLNGSHITAATWLEGGSRDRYDCVRTCM
jgi:hypothetical protein